jgi:hypothetical protein
MAQSDHSQAGAQDVPQAPARPMVTMREAAELCGVSFDVIKRARVAGRFPGAEQADDATRTWRIPLGELGAAGFHPGRPTPADTPAEDGATVPLGEHRAVVAERDRLAVEVARLSGEVEGYRQAVEIARLSLRALPAATDAQEPATAPTERRRGFWR